MVEPPTNDCRTIPLTKGYSAIVDAEDFDRVSEHSWCAEPGGGRTHNTMYAQARVNGKLIRLHQFILGRISETIIDHKDRNGLNNQKSNLRRINNKAGNSHNSCIPRNNTSGFKGVYFYKRGNKWKAQICYSGCRMGLGTFDDPISAAIKLFGDFANTNKMMGRI
jgi:hypothetical protein